MNPLEQFLRDRIAELVRYSNEFESVGHYRGLDRLEEYDYSSTRAMLYYNKALLKYVFGVSYE